MACHSAPHHAEWEPLLLEQDTAKCLRQRSFHTLDLDLASCESLCPFFLSFSFTCSDSSPDSLEEPSASSLSSSPSSSEVSSLPDSSSSSYKREQSGLPIRETGGSPCFFTKYGLVWSTMSGSVSMLHLIVRPVFNLSD